MHPSELSRRRLLRGLLAAPALAAVYGCSNDEATSPASSTRVSAPATTSTGPATSTVPATTVAESTTAATTATTAPEIVGWASGGTDLITVAYPPTSIFDTARRCDLSLTQAVMEGPCYFQSDTTDDISLGKTGLPMQLCVQLVDLGCAPLAGYTIEVWHCDTRGIYSGDTTNSADASRFAGGFCTFDDAEALASAYMRGQATTDGEGRVNFKTIFPGWYAGRTIHIHFAVSDQSGTRRIISQWCYPDDLTEEICTTHEQYAERGVQDTTLASGTDGVFPPGDYDAFMMSTQANSDGSILGYTVVQIDPASVATESSM